MIFYFYKPIAWSSIIWIYFISGLWLWIGGRNNDLETNYHMAPAPDLWIFTFYFLVECSEKT